MASSSSPFDGVILCSSSFSSGPSGPSTEAHLSELRCVLGTVQQVMFVLLDV